MQWGCVFYKTLFFYYPWAFLVVVMGISNLIVVIYIRSMIAIQKSRSHGVNLFSKQLSKYLGDINALVKQIVSVQKKVLD